MPAFLLCARQSDCLGGWSSRAADTGCRLHGEGRQGSTGRISGLQTAHLSRESLVPRTSRLNATVRTRASPFYSEKDPLL